MAEAPNVVDMIQERVRAILHAAADEYLETAIQAGKCHPLEADVIMDAVDADFARIMKSVRTLAITIASRQTQLNRLE